MRERERERETETETETDRQKQTDRGETDRQTDRQTETETATGREGGEERQRVTLNLQQTGSGLNLLHLQKPTYVCEGRVTEK